MEWWRPALDGRPGSLAQPAGFKRIFARATAFFYTLVLGPWVLWQKTFPNRQVKVILRQRLLGVAFLACFIAYLLAPGLVTVTAMAGLGGILAWSYLWARRRASERHGLHRPEKGAPVPGRYSQGKTRLINNSPS